MWVSIPFVLDRGKKQRVASGSSDLSPRWLNMTVSVMNKGKP
nr:MAG TPA: hypothetical protein [Caudoviricetes sp.]